MLLQNDTLQTPRTTVLLEKLIVSANKQMSCIWWYPDMYCLSWAR